MSTVVFTYNAIVNSKTTIAVRLHKNLIEMTTTDRYSCSNGNYSKTIKGYSNENPNSSKL